jgi:hypothetical protein
MEIGQENLMYSVLLGPDSDSLTHKGLDELATKVYNLLYKTKTSTGFIYKIIEK